jgi:putative DNA primase/helicase
MTPAEELTARLRGKWRGSYGEAKCVGHDDRNPSLTIRDGDSAPLLRCHAGCDSKVIIDILRRDGLWPDDERCDRNAVPQRDNREAEKREFALKLWREAHPIEGTLAEQYLRARGISGPLPPTLRFATLKHTPTGLWLPGMVAAVQGPDRRIMAVHRTYLRGDGAGKAPVSNPRMMLGSVRGGTVRLAAAEPQLGIGEGVETSLAFQRATGTATWAALSTSGIINVVLPPKPAASTVILLVDADEAGEKACAQAAQRLAREGRTVKLARPTSGNDFAEAILGDVHV